MISQQPEPRVVIDLLLCALVNARGRYECPVCGQVGSHYGECWLHSVLQLDGSPEDVWIDRLLGIGDRDDPTELDGPKDLRVRVEALEERTKSLDYSVEVFQKHETERIDDRLGDHDNRLLALTVGLNEVRMSLGMAPVAPGFFDPAGAVRDDKFPSGTQPASTSEDDDIPF